METDEPLSDRKSREARTRPAAGRTLKRVRRRLLTTGSGRRFLPLLKSRLLQKRSPLRRNLLVCRDQLPKGEDVGQIAEEVHASIDHHDVHSRRMKAED